MINPHAGQLRLHPMPRFRSGRGRLVSELIGSTCDQPDIPIGKKGPIGWRYALIDQDNRAKEPYSSISPRETDPPLRRWRLDALAQHPGDAFELAVHFARLKIPASRPGHDHEK